jgi:phytol kinase
MNFFETICQPYSTCEHILYIGLYLFVIGIIVLINRLLKKTGKVHVEIIRKIPHIFGGLIIIQAAISLPKTFFLIFLAILTLGALISYRHKKQFPAIYSVSRKTFGTILYPLTLLILATFLLPDHLGAFLYGAMMMILVDGPVAIVGSLFGKNIHPYEKSFVGSVTFLILGSVIGYMIITIHEFFVKWGIDNFTIPVLSVLLWLLFL